MIKINIREAGEPIYKATSINRQAHFLNFESLIGNILRFFERYSGKYVNVESKIRGINKVMIDELNTHLENYGVNMECLLGCDKKLYSRAFLKVNDPNSLGYSLKVVDRRMLIKVNRFESKENIESFVLSQEDSSNLEKYYLEDDFLNLFNKRNRMLKSPEYEESKLKKNLKTWDDFKPNEWMNTSGEVSEEKKNRIIGTALTFVSGLESLRGKKKFDISNIKEFVIDAKINNGPIAKKDIDSLFLIPVGTIVGTTIKDGIMALSNSNDFDKNNKEFKHKEKEFILEEDGDVFNSVGNTISKIFW